LRLSLDGGVNFDFKGRWEIFFGAIMRAVQQSPDMTARNYHWRIAGFYFFYFAFVGMFSPRLRFRGLVEV
jgi:hypothetical protein